METEMFVHFVILLLCNIGAMAGVVWYYKRQEAKINAPEYEEIKLEPSDRKKILYVCLGFAGVFIIVMAIMMEALKDVEGVDMRLMPTCCMGVGAVIVGILCSIMPKKLGRKEIVVLSAVEKKRLHEQNVAVLARAMVILMMFVGLLVWCFMNKI